MNNISKEELNALAKAKIHPDKMTIVIVGNKYLIKNIKEILEINKSLKQAILSNLQQNELNALAKKNGFRPMQEMGHDLLLSGDLTFSEYSRVLQAN